VPWRGVDGTTGGPLNSYPISVLLLLGFKAGYVLAHLLATVLVCLHVVVAYRTLLRLTAPTVAIFAVLPMTLGYSYTADTGLLHCASELWPALFLSLGFWAFVAWLQGGVDRKPFRRVLALFPAGLAFGAAPWCKLQALPIAAALTVAALAAILFKRRPSGSAHRRVTSAAVFLAGALLPAAILLGVVAHGGVLRDFWNSYILANLGYTGGKTPIATLTGCVSIIRNRYLAPVLLMDMLAAGYLFYRRPEEHTRDSPRELWIPGTVLVYACAALFVVCRPVTDYSHYTIFLFQPMTYLAAVWLPRDLGRLAPGHAGRPKPALAIVVFVALAMVGACFVNGVRYGRYVAATVQGIPHPQPDSNERLFTEIQKIRERRPAGSLAIWGWTPGVYVLTGIPPATRDAIGHFVITAGPLQPYFRRRFLRDLRDTMPDLFIDAVADGVFVWPSWRDTDGYESDAELKTLIDGNYCLVDDLTLLPGGKPVRFFARRESPR
jgi:hypothetical protein